MLISGATKLAGWAWVSSVVVGLTVVAYGTSTPELIVSVSSSWSGHDGMALGNVIGSNIFNILFILGTSALLIPLVVEQKLLRQEVPLLILLTGGTYLLCWNGILSIREGILLLLFLVGYTIWAVVESREVTRAIREEYEKEFPTHPGRLGTIGIITSFLLVGTGLALLITGSRMFISGATTIARSWGVSELVIGLTIVGAGTSLPEVVTSLLAVWRGETDIAVGNVIGSNLFNISGVLGLSAVVSGEGIPITFQILTTDFLFLVLATLLCSPIFLSDHRITRWEGVAFLALFTLYLFGKTL